MKLFFDPRTKVILIFLTVICTLFFPSLEWEGVFIAFIILFGILSGKTKESLIRGAIFYTALILWNLNVKKGNTGLGATTTLAWLALLFKLFPCCILAGIIVRSTRIGDFLTAMNEAHVPKEIYITLAVMLRYLPTLKEDWGYIKDAMKLRGVSPTPASFFHHPVTTIECLYVPLLITASKTADELSIAAVTRGIENPEKRSSINELKFRFCDVAAILVFSVLTAITVFLGVKAK